ncbi:glycosyl transferase [Coniothyrium glycines]
MVLFKRKPVKLEPAPKSLDDHTEIWVIEETGEVFTDYEGYLERYDFYQQKSFTCETTGHTGFTYFEAKESETEASKEINLIFPDGLRAPVLRYVQFQDHSRMDDLVNDVFDNFKEHFVIGDRVSIENDNSRRFGAIQDITDNSRTHNMFTGQAMEDPVRSYTYVIKMDDNGEVITKYRASELQRDRKIYSKLILKQFLRNTVTREPWIGAPWKVKETLAKRFDISTKVPDHKTREAVLAHKRALQNGQANGHSPPVQQPFHQQGPNGHGPQVNGHRHLPFPNHGRPGFVNFATSGPQQYAQNPGLPPPFAALNPPYIIAFPPHYHHNGGPPAPPYGGPPGVQLPPHLAHILQHPPQPIHMPFQTSFPHNQGPRPSLAPQPQQVPQLAKPFEPVKYPCEDLEIKLPRLVCERPALKFLSDDVPEDVEPPAVEKKTGILMKSVGSLLFAWETLNVHDVVYQLDSFTFDDFVDAMRFTHPEIQCELFVEIHCSVLKQIVNSAGTILPALPGLPETQDSEEEDSSRESTPTPEPEPLVRTTRSSLRKSEAQQLVIKARTPTPEPPKELHKAANFIVDFDWIEQCKTRNFLEGGWEAIVVALLYRLSFDPAQKETCDEILGQLVPTEEEEPTIETIAANYVDLDVNLRISALDIILRLTISTDAFREQLVSAAQEMTRLRKEKIEHQRRRKDLADELFKLDLERKIQLPENTPDSPADAKDVEDMDISMTSIPDDSKLDIEADEEEDKTVTKNNRTRPKNKRKAAAEEARKEKAKKVKAEAEKTKKQKAWERLLIDIRKKKDELRECEAMINELDDDLRETLVHRSKVLGKDRFLNKYYWFEHNGMPFGGLPTSSTAEYGYANGRIWVQGPDKYELQPCLEESAMAADMEKYGFTIPQRKQKEEGATHLSNSNEWAYYDTPEDIDQLLLWLDERGCREKVLRKELQTFRDRIVEYMVIMRKHLAESQDTKGEDEENTTRISTRNKTYIDRESVKDRCLLWTNSIMRDENGYSHSEEYEPPKKTKAKSSKATKAKGKR